MTGVVGFIILFVYGLVAVVQSLEGQTVLYSAFVADVGLRRFMASSKFVYVVITTAAAA